MSSDNEQALRLHRIQNRYPHDPKWLMEEVKTQLIRFIHGSNVEKIVSVDIIWKRKEES